MKESDSEVESVGHVCVEDQEPTDGQRSLYLQIQQLKRSIQSSTPNPASGESFYQSTCQRMEGVQAVSGHHSKLLEQAKAVVEGILHRYDPKTEDVVMGE